jgi:hypothetical protein
VETLADLSDCLTLQHLLYNISIVRLVDKLSGQMTEKVLQLAVWRFFTGPFVLPECLYLEGFAEGDWSVC